MTNVTMDLVDAIGEAFNANNIGAVMKFFLKMRSLTMLSGRMCMV